MKVLISGVALSALLYYLLSPTTPIKFRELSRERLQSLVTSLYYRGREGASLVIGARDQSFTVTKRILTIGDIRLFGRITLPPEARSNIELRNRLSELHTRFAFESPDQTIRLRIIEFEFVQDFTAVGAFIMQLTSAGWDVDIEREGIATLHNVSERSARIGWEK